MKEKQERLNPMRLIGAVAAAALVVLTLWVGGADRVWSLLTSVRPFELAVAASAAAGSLVMRGLRLSLLLPPGVLKPLRAVPVAAVAQAAALFVPARVGELALPWLLRRDSGRDGAAGIATLLAARTLDTAALGAWAGAAIIFRHGLNAPLALAAALGLLLPLVLVPMTVTTIDAFVCRRESAWGEKGALWANRVHRIREGLDEARRSPGRLIGAGLACLTSWAFQWTLAWWLLAAMGFRWPIWDVVTGSAVASLSNLLPFNLVANFGTLEAGWTAAFAAMGVPLNLAAATGLATHIWALIFAAVFGALAWFTLGRKKGDHRKPI
ncbi:MAG: flippase-like domain-containing protein [Thermoanaerobaculales bacterium]|nr:flippase-like domain-containing protein [Thermoanaerobaculales bacterium]